MHQCPIPAVFRSPAKPPPMPYVALALVNCLKGQPLKTILGLCCCPAGFHVAILYSICLLVYIMHFFPINTVPLIIAGNKYFAQICEFKTREKFILERT
jgi:hypothetical protein